MGQTEAVRQYALMKLQDIAETSKGKEIPNWFKIDDMVGFGIRISEGDLNFQVSSTAYPIPNEPAGTFLLTINASFMSRPVSRNGFEFMPVPLSALCEMQFQMFAEDEQELMDGILQVIHDEADNILCRILQ